MSTTLQKTQRLQTWNAAGYAKHGRFVADLAGGVVELLAPEFGERILDVGCGDGALTRKLAATGAQVTGIDSSEQMIDAAKELGLDARVIDAEKLPFVAEFDAAFSNAALHWIRDQDAVLSGVRRALKPGGRFIAEMGGFGNIAAIEVALQAACAHWGFDAFAAGQNCFPTPTAYAARLEHHGFLVQQIALIPRPTLLPASGMRGWIETFRRGLLDQLPPEAREPVIEDAVALLKPVLCDEVGQWTADYVRLRFRALAKKAESGPAPRIEQLSRS
jgi:trans-aconitate methyltransferase